MYDIISININIYIYIMRSWRVFRSCPVNAQSMPCTWRPPEMTSVSAPAGSTDRGPSFSSYRVTI